MRVRFSLLLLVPGSLAISAPSLALAGGYAAPRQAANSSAPNLPRSAASDTLWRLVFREAPTATYGSYQAATDTLRKVLVTILGAYADSAEWKSELVDFYFSDSFEVVVNGAVSGRRWAIDAYRESVPSLTMSVEYRPFVDPEDLFEDSLQTKGWRVDPLYEGLGAEGGSFAMACREALCVIRGSWAGGLDEPEPTELYIEVQCVPTSGVRRKLP